MLKLFKVSLLAIAVACAGCSDSAPAQTDTGAGDGTGDTIACIEPMPPQPGACASIPQMTFQGQHKLVMDTLGTPEEGVGFDLNNEDCDGDIRTGVDSALRLLGPFIKQPLEEALQSGEIVIALEFDQLDDAVNDDCVNFSLYFGRFPPDRDEDGEGAGGPVAKPGKDCNDLDPAINKGVAEIPGNFVDDDCDGLADEDDSVPPVPSTDTQDQDGDGVTIADGDCDDRPVAVFALSASINPGEAEVCGDSIDNDCDGTADEGCLPVTDGMTYRIDPAGLNAAQDQSQVQFNGATITAGKLFAGPSLFSVPLELDEGTTFDLNLTNVFIEADVAETGGVLSLSNGILTGVLDVRVLETAPNLLFELAGVGNENDTLLDVLVISTLGSLLNLPTDGEGNIIPDVDVDGDGIEKFKDNNLDGDANTQRVDTCIDGDGTEFQDQLDSNGVVIEHCTEAVDASGKKRFVDGFSLGLKFSAVKTDFAGVAPPIAQQ